MATERERQIVAQLEDYCRLLRDTVLRLCPRTLGIHREDIEQEARVRLWRALQREREVSNPSSYLYRVVTSVTIDAIRQVRARREVPLSDALAVDGDQRTDQLEARSPSPEEKTACHELVQRLRGALEMLPDDRRRAVGLHLQGFTTSEIASLLGWTEPRARNLVYRALKDVRERLRDELTKRSGTVPRVAR